MSDLTPTNPAAYAMIVRQTSTYTTAITGSPVVPYNPLWKMLNPDGVLGSQSTGSWTMTGDASGFSQGLAAGGYDFLLVTDCSEGSVRVGLYGHVAGVADSNNKAYVDPPSSLSGMDILYRTGAATDVYAPCAATLADGTQVVFGRWGAAASTFAAYSKPVGGSWAAISGGSGAFFNTTDGSDAISTPLLAGPAVVALPDGGLAVFAVDGSKNLVSWWAPKTATPIGTYAKYTGVSVTGYTPTKIRAAYANGQIAVFVSTEDAVDRVFQYASADFGLTLDYVDVLTGVGYAEVCSVSDSFVLAYLLASDKKPYSRRLGDAYSTMSSGTPVLSTNATDAALWCTTAAGLFTAGELSLCSDSAGNLWLFGADHDAGGGALKEGYVRQSQDGGITWDYVGSGPGPGSGLPWWRSLDAATRPSAFSMCYAGGRFFAGAKAKASVANNSDSSLLALSLGEWTTDPMPQTSYTRADAKHATGWYTNWLAINLPENTGATWTRTTAGAPVVSFTTPGMRVAHAGVLDTEAWNCTPTYTLAVGTRFEARDIRVDAGRAEFRVRIGDATPRSYDVRVRVSSTGFDVYDMNGGGAGVPALLKTGTATLKHLRLWAYEDVAGVSAALRIAYVTTEAFASVAGVGRGVTEWRVATLALLPGVVAGNDITFRTVVGVATTDVYFRSISWGSSGVPSTTSPKLGMQITSKPAAVAELGMQLSASGFFATNDYYAFRTESRNPPGNTDPKIRSSPKASWRFDKTTNNLMYFDSSDSDNNRYDGGTLAVCFVGCNIHTADFVYWDAATAATITNTIDFDIGSGLKYTRIGSHVYCDPSGGNDLSDYIPANALAGHVFRFGGGGAVRRIKSNTPGRWCKTSTMATGLRPILILEGVDGTEAAAGAGASISSPTVTKLIRGVSAGSYPVNLDIASQVTPDDYGEIGCAFVGQAVPIAHRSSRGNQHGIKTNIQITEAKDGTRRATKEGSARRYEIIDWVDGIDTTNVHQSSPDYVRENSTAGEVIGNPAATPFDMFGLLQTDAENCLMYLPSVTIPAAATDSTIRAPYLQLYGRIVTDTLQMDVVLGNTWTGTAGELVRVGSVRFEEEL